MEIRSLTRAVAILKHLGSESAGASLSQIAGEVGLSKATASRFLRALLAVDFVRFDTNRGRYFLGQGLVRLALLFAPHSELKSLARRSLLELRDQTTETVALVVAQGTERITIDVILSPHELKAAPEIGSSKPIYAGAAGKALLSTYSNSELEKILHDVVLVSLAPGTIVAPTELRRDLIRVRDRGYAISVEETVRGQAAVAAPILRPNGSVAGAINLCGPSVRLPRAKLQAFGNLVAGVARNLSLKLAADQNVQIADRMTCNSGSG